jgi:hypothetical protein
MVGIPSGCTFKSPPQPLSPVTANSPVGIQVHETAWTNLLASRSRASAITRQPMRDPLRRKRALGGVPTPLETVTFGSQQ